VAVPPEKPPAKHRRHRGLPKWGFNLHLVGALLDNHLESVDNTAMGGLGFGFRFRPLPALAFDADVDFLKGTDHQGFYRTEASFLLNTLLFFNPRDVLQIYALAGIGFTGAEVTLEARRGETLVNRLDEHYSYFGGQFGLGMEVRVSRKVAIAGDVLGFVRGRTDEQLNERPEYVDRYTQRGSENSGGGMLRLGVTFYW
jgi:hypothetical protein